MSDIPSKPKRQHGLDIKDRLARHRFEQGECWETVLEPNQEYPKIKIMGRKVLVHRISYSVHVGPIPDGMYVLHKCDNPRCHRPDHLFLGTSQDNMKDMVSKGRHRAASKKIIDERMAINLGAVLSQAEVAECMGVSQTIISRVLRANNASRGKSTSFGKAHGLGGRPKK